MNKELEKVRQIFLNDDGLDEETKEDNAKKILEWEQGLIANEAFAGWKDHDVTRQIEKQAKDSYKDIAMRLYRDRTLTDTQRVSLWAKQDAIQWILSLTEKDAKGAIEQINKEIKLAIDMS